MNIYLKKHDDKKHINIKDVIYFTSQLGKFLNVYEKFILIKNDEDRAALVTLEQIHHLFETRQYEYLFREHIDNVDFDPSHVNFTDEEILAWEAFFGKQS